MEISVEPLRERNIMIATPAYGGQMNCTYVRSLLALQQLFLQCGLKYRFQFIYNESLISRARNTLADLFLQSDCTDLLFIDSDIEFEPQDVIALMHFDKDVIGGAYPRKSLEWNNIKKTLQKNPDLPAEELAKMGATWSTHFFKDTTTLNGMTPTSVQEIATGFMMIKRGVLEKMKDVADEYIPDTTQGQLENRPVWDFFPVGPYMGRYESEDYSFCRIWRELGGEVFVCPWIKLNHMGAYNFIGDLNAVAAKLGELH